LSIKSNASGKTGKIGLYETSHIDIFMTQTTPYVASTDASNDFEITLTRTTLAEIGLVTIFKGGMVIGIVLGVLGFLVLLIGLVCLYKKKCSKLSEQEQRD